jgi:hypothetical protein
VRYEGSDERDREADDDGDHGQLHVLDERGL